MSTVAEVRLWGSTIGAVSLEDGERVAAFQYDPAFAASGVQVAPIAMPLAEWPYAFPGLSARSFRGLPGMLADSLPDRYGNALIDAWLGAQGRTPESFNAVERLCYIGSRGMGALEYAPSRGPRRPPGGEIEIEALVRLAAEVLGRRRDLNASLSGSERAAAMRDILSVGTSAGGARAKAVIAYNPETGAVRSGQIDAGPGFEQWLLKFDGVSADDERELDYPQGYGTVELAYANMARAAGIEMTEARLLEESGRRHFMTRRFDRPAGGGKLHMQSLGAIAHYDFNDAGAHSYEQALMVIRRLGMGMDSVEQQFRRTAFNVIARNQDDHVKNIAFVMDRSGRWELSPAFDLAYSYNPSGTWTDRHQMSLAGKRDGFTVEDFRQVGRVATLKRGQAERILEEIRAVVSHWPRYAKRVGVDDTHIKRITPTLRLKLPPR